MLEKSSFTTTQDPVMAPFYNYIMAWKSLLLFYSGMLVSGTYIYEGTNPVIVTSSTGGKFCMEESRITGNYSHQNLTRLPGGISQDTTDLDLSHNNIRSIPNSSFHNLEHLRLLLLSNNNVSQLEANSFSGLKDLCYLDLSENPLSTASFPEAVFQDTLNLKVLHLGRIDGHFPDKALSNLASLRQMFVSPPNGLHLGSGFSSMTSLQEFHITGGSVGELTNDTFSVFKNLSLKLFSCFRCGLSDIEAGAFVPLKQLDVLDISMNFFGLPNAMRSLYGLQNRNMTSITLAGMNDLTTFLEYNNYILTGKDAEFLKTICVKSLDLSWNDIVCITDQFFSSLRFPACIKSFSIKGHRLLIPSRGLFRILELKNLEYLDMTGLLGIRQQKPDSLPPNLRSGKNVDSHTTGNVEGIHVVLVTPPNLTYFFGSRVLLNWKYGPHVKFSNTPKLRSLDLSYNGMKGCSVPFSTDTNALQVLNISGIDCSVVTPATFIKFPGLKILELADVNLGVGVLADTGGELFRYQTQLTSLNLADNGLASLHRNLFSETKLVTKLSLRNNKLMRIPLTLRNLNSLEELDMSYNSLTYIGESDRLWLDTMSTKTQLSVSLDGNPLSCTCPTVDFLQWLFETQVMILGKDNLTCTLADGILVGVMSFKKGLPDFQVGCVSKFWLKFSVTSAAVVGVLLCLSVACFKYRYNIWYWIRSKCKPGAERTPPDEDYLYDAFVAYNHHNYRWTCFSLREFLEDRHPYKLCLHHRDFPVGESIQQNIVDAVNSSRKIILVISKDYLSSDWGEFEIQMAGMKRVQEGRENVVVVILLEDIPVRQMPRCLINMWKNITFLLWTEDPADTDLFWERLELAMRRP